MHAGRRSSNAAHFEPMALATGDDEVDSPVQYRRLAPNAIYFGGKTKSAVER